MRQPPDFPAGPTPTDPTRIDAEWLAHVDSLSNAPTLIRACVADLTEAQLDTRYKNWTVRQIVHHIADSHANAYTRFKLALTEDWPTIRPYDEGSWCSLADSRTMPVDAPLALLEGIHGSLAPLLRQLSADERARGYIHPEYGKRYTLSLALPLYTWHGRHHLAQIEWLAHAHNWK